MVGIALMEGRRYHVSGLAIWWLARTHDSGSRQGETGTTDLRLRGAPLYVPGSSSSGRQSTVSQTPHHITF